jgi:hypothetical protein
MSGRRLHGWARIGIVLSTVWAISGSLWALNLLFEPVYQNYATCRTLIIVSPSDCRQLFETQFADARQRRLTAVAVVGLGPIPVAWLLVYALVVLVRWIKRGFQDTP